VSDKGIICGGLDPFFLLGGKVCCHPFRIIEHRHTQLIHAHAFILLVDESVTSKTSTKEAAGEPKGGKYIADDTYDCPCKEGDMDVASVFEDKDAFNTNRVIQIE